MQPGRSTDLRPLARSGLPDSAQSAPSLVNPLTPDTSDPLKTRRLGPAPQNHDPHRRVNAHAYQHCFSHHMSGMHLSARHRRLSQRTAHAFRRCGVPRPRPRGILWPHRSLPPTDRLASSIDQESHSYSRRLPALDSISSL